MDSSVQPRLVQLIQADGSGGGPVSVATQLSYLRETFNCWVLHGGNGRLSAFCESAGLPHLRLPLEHLRPWSRGLWLLRRTLRRLQPDLVVLNGQWISPWGALFARGLRIPATVYVARWPAFYTDWDLLRMGRNFLAEWIPCRYSDRVIALTESTRYRYLLRRLVDESRLVQLPNPLDLRTVPSSEQRTDFRRSHGWSEDAQHVVLSSRLSDQKRVDWLVRSWPRVVEACPRARLWVVGDGPERARLEALRNGLGLVSTCTFVGEVPDALPYVASADVVVVTSLYESFGRSLVEAMACGRPVVATSADGFRDLLRDGIEGVLVPPGDADALADRVIRLLKHPTLRSILGEAGRRTAQGYAADVVMPQYRDLFLAVLAEKRSRASQNSSRNLTVRSTRSPPVRMAS